MPPPQKGLPAELLWPNGGHLDFRAWQKKQTVKVSPVGKHVSGPEEYHRYMSRDRTSSTGSFSISSLAAFFLRATDLNQPECGHKLHASAPVETFCPVCQVDHYIAFLNAITNVWEEFGGPFRNDYQLPSVSNGYIKLRVAWRAARLGLINLVEKLEKQAIIENRMDSYGLPSTFDQSDGPHPTLYRAQAALDKFRLTYRYPVVNWPRQIEDGLVTEEWHTPKSTPKQKKQVHFERNLADGSTRDDSSFQRTHVNYVRGPHAAAPGSQFENTTCNNDIDTILAQTKVLFTKKLGFKAYAEKPKFWPPFEGTAGCHPRWEEILTAVEMYATQRSYPKFCEWQKELSSSGVDGLAMLTDHDKIVDFVVLKAPKENLWNPIERRASWVSPSDAE